LCATVSSVRQKTLPSRPSVVGLGIEIGGGLSHMVDLIARGAVIDLSASGDGRRSTLRTSPFVPVGD
jgi:hypothetical protein